MSTVKYTYNLNKNLLNRKYNQESRKRMLTG